MCIQRRSNGFRKKALSYLRDERMTFLQSNLPGFYIAHHTRNIVHMSNIYRIYPVLWEGNGCLGAQTVYACDRQPSANSFPTACSSRPRTDPASVWDSCTLWRLLPTPNLTDSCSRPVDFQAVTWYTLPAWLSWVLEHGYTLQGNTTLSKLAPHSDIYIVGP